MAEIYAERCAHSTAPYPGIMELLERLERLDVRMAVLSNKPHEMTRRLLATFFAQVRFERVEGARAGVARKPDPRMALEIAASLEAAPERVVYVGDTDTDMRTANAAGMHAVGALWGFREAEELRAAGARTLVSRPSELLELFD
jgi:phosphoglycolate phosphatase